MKLNLGMQSVQRGIENVRLRAYHNGMLRNRWIPPEGEELDREFELVRRKESKLSSRQRLMVILLHGIREKEGDKN